jgi:hypothetical protein
MNGLRRNDPPTRAEPHGSAVLLEAAIAIFAAGLLAGTVAAVIGSVAGISEGSRRLRRDVRASAVPIERHANVRAAAAR